MTSFNGKTIGYNSMGCPTSYGNKNLTWNRGKLSGITERSGIGFNATSESYTFAYNAKGQRVIKTYAYYPGTQALVDYMTDSNSVFTYDNAGRLIYEKRYENYQQGYSYTREFTYLYDESGMIGFTYSYNGGTPQTYYYQRNLLGDVVAIYNTSGVKQAGYAYDAWGNCTITNNTNPDIATANAIRYRGYYFDTETGFYYLNSRYYNPEWRRFISPDDTSYLDPESVNGLNLYCYCYNDPVNYCDPSGHFIISLTSILIAAGIGAALGAVSGAIYGGFTAAANGQNVWGGIMIGAVTGAFMGAGAGVASLFIAPILAGGSVVIGATSISAGASLAIGAGISFGTGAIGGAVSDIWTQHINNGDVTDIDSVIKSAFQWGTINTFGAFLGSVGGPLSNLETALITGVFNNVTGSIGLTVDAIRGNNSRRRPILV